MKQSKIKEEMLNTKVEYVVELYNAWDYKTNTLHDLIDMHNNESYDRYDDILRSGIIDCLDKLKQKTLFNKSFIDYIMVELLKEKNTQRLDSLVSSEVLENYNYHNNNFISKLFNGG